VNGRDTKIDQGRGDASPTCFLHIPKSAGSSILSALEAALPQGSLAPRQFDSSLFCDFEHFELLRPEVRSRIAASPSEVRALSGYRAVSGHFSLPTLLQVADASAISTMLREPRARLLSLYMYWRTPGLGDIWDPYRAYEHARRPLSEFLSEPRLAPVLDNQVCRMLLHGDPRLPESSFAAASDIEAIAADAVERLDTLGFVGVLELGDDAWRGVARLFAVTLDPVSVNVTGEHVVPEATQPEGEVFAADVLDLIERRSAADLLVYDHALIQAGLDARERRRLMDSAFARQLVKLGDLVGHSAARAAERSEAVGVLSSQLKDQGRLRRELSETRDRLEEHAQTVQGLEDQLRRRDEDLLRLRRWLDAEHASASWRLTAPFRAAKHGMQRFLRPALGGSRILAPAREQSMLGGWSVGQVWGFALILSSLIAATDAILTHVVLIALLAAGPFCGLLTGRWARTASTGIWAIVLAVPLGLPDHIWGTRTQLVDLSVVAVAALLSIFAAILIERRRYRQVG
jgi:hypothetical protein